MKKNKRGTSTLFLAIILSALILVETTYIAFVADLDRRLTYTRALKEQTEIYLASYDRLLFKTYGIYAFNTSNIDSLVFNEILAANGYQVGDVMYASGIYSLDTETLRRSVAAYYSYRLSGVLFERFSAQIMALVNELGNGIIDEIREFVASPASGQLGRIIRGGAEVTQAISYAAEFLGLDESSPSMQTFMDIISGVGAITNSSPDIGNGFDPVDMSFIFDVMGFTSSIYDIGTAFNENINIHGCLSYYAGNNFDCVLDDDTSINGTSFSEFHSDNEYDSEYILTGLEGIPGCALTDYYIFCCLYLRRIVMNMTDPSMEEIITSVSEILSVAITALSVGTVALPPQVYEAVIILLISEIQAISDLIDILHGGQVALVSIGEVEAITLDYRNFLTVFMNLVPDDLLLSRMLTVLNRDFPDYAIGIEVETDYRGGTLCYEASYELYE